MYSIYKYINNATDEVDFLGAVNPTGFFNLTGADYDFDSRSTDRPKMEAHGSWPTFANYERMHINLEGTVVAGNAEDFAAFIQENTQALMPAPEALQTDRTQGEVHLRFEGYSITYSVPVVVETPLKVASGPGLAPSAGTFRIVFKAFRPYFYDPIGDSYYWVS